MKKDQTSTARAFKKLYPLGKCTVCRRERVRIVGKVAGQNTNICAECYAEGTIPVQSP